jgi:hypothetical protein
MPKATVSLPRLFVGSSREGKDVAHAVRQQLKDVAEVTLWSDGLFGLSGGTLESLVAALTHYDFAVLAVTADDLTTSRGTEQASPRDNVVFEAGLFMGRLGRERTFLVYDTVAEQKLPSDLAGITHAEFRRRSGGTLRAAVGEATDDIRDHIKQLGPFLTLDSPSVGETVGRNIRARGRCSAPHASVAVVVHPVGSRDYWLRRGEISVPGEWQADLTIGMVSGSSGKEYDLRAFLLPAPSNDRNPLSWWPSALTGTPAIRVRRA